MEKRQYSKLDSHKMYEQLSIAEKESVAKWIVDNMTLRKKANYNHTSYGLKHHFQNDTGIYLNKMVRLKAQCRQPGMLL